MTLIDSWFLFLIPLFPLLGAVYSGLFGAAVQRRWGERAVYLPSVLLPWASFVVAAVAFVRLAGADHHSMLHQRLWTWFDVGQLSVDLAFAVDRLSAVMALVVTFVGSLIHVYSTGYMRGDPSFFRYFSYLNLFMFSMLVLVLGDSLLLLFVGWEGVGLCSYLLIGFWYTDPAKAAAGMKAFIVNRVGDAGFLLGMFTLFWGLYRSATPAVSAHGAALPATSLEFRVLEEILTDPARVQAFAAQQWVGISLVTVSSLLLFIGAIGKSAQLPLYVWLPDAMAGPTPVSALIHAATMVTAGVYLLARLHFLFAWSPEARTVVVVVGVATALVAASIGVFQHDVKKVLAYSTVSQLGFMFVAVGSGAFWVGIFHLMTHALFKACLFLGAGSVILGCHHEQDMRRMGGLRKLMPVTAASYFVSCAAIAGFPFFSGFFSKDEILWKTFNSADIALPGGGLLPWAVAAFAALLTSFYMFRSYYMVFSGEYRGAAHGAAAHGAAAHGAAADGGADAAHAQDHGDHHAHGLPKESPWSMAGVLAILGVLAVIGGYLGLPHLWHMPNLFEGWLEPVFASSEGLIHWAGHGHGTEWGLMIGSIAIALGGFGLARWLYLDGKNPIPARLLADPRPSIRGVHRVISRSYYIDELYNAVFVNGATKLARALAWLDSRAVDGVVNLCGSIGRVCGEFQGLVDRTLVDGLVNWVADTIFDAGKNLRRMQTGRIQSYVWGIVAGSMLLLVFVYMIPW